LYRMKDVEEAMSIVKEAMKEGTHAALTTADSDKEQIRIVSIHWGPNWALRGESESELQARRELAHRFMSI